MCGGLFLLLGGRMVVSAGEGSVQAALVQTLDTAPHPVLPLRAGGHITSPLSQTTE